MPCASASAWRRACSSITTLVPSFPEPNSAARPVEPLQGRVPYEFTVYKRAKIETFWIITPYYICFSNAYHI
jgi:hypothetical protein